MKLMVIPPSLVKNYSRTPFPRLWAYLEMLLRCARRLVVVGTSLRTEDILLHHVLGFLNAKCQYLEEVIVVDPEEDAARRVEAIARVPVHSYTSLAGFNEGYGP